MSTENTKKVDEVISGDPKESGDQSVSKPDTFSDIVRALDNFHGNIPTPLAPDYEGAILSASTVIPTGDSELPAPPAPIDGHKTLQLGISASAKQAQALIMAEADLAEAEAKRKLQDEQSKRALKPSGTGFDAVTQEQVQQHSAATDVAKVKEVLGTWTEIYERSLGIDLQPIIGDRGLLKRFRFEGLRPLTENERVYISALIIKCLTEALAVRGKSGFIPPLLEELITENIDKIPEGVLAKNSVFAELLEATRALQVPQNLQYEEIFVSVSNRVLTR